MGSKAVLDTRDRAAGSGDTKIAATCAFDESKLPALPHQAHAHFTSLENHIRRCESGIMHGTSEEARAAITIRVVSEPLPRLLGPCPEAAKEQLLDIRSSRHGAFEAEEAKRPDREVWSPREAYTSLSQRSYASSITHSSPRASLRGSTSLAL